MVTKTLLISLSCLLQAQSQKLVVDGADHLLMQTSMVPVICQWSSANLYQLIIWSYCHNRSWGRLVLFHIRLWYIIICMAQYECMHVFNFDLICIEGLFHRCDLSILNVVNHYGTFQFIFCFPWFLKCAETPCTKPAKRVKWPPDWSGKKNCSVRLMTFCNYPAA